MTENILSPGIERRHRVNQILYLRLVPICIAGIALGAMGARFGVWVGDNDLVGRGLLGLTAACSIGGIFFRRARVALSMLVIFAFGGRAIGFILFGTPEQSWLNRAAAAVQWGCITLGCLIMIQMWSTIVAFRDERRAAGIE